MEIIFAFALLAVGLVEGAILLSKGGFNNSITGKNVVALTLAKERIENIKNMPYAGVASAAGVFPVPYDSYFYQVIVTALPGPSAETKDVYVVVSSSTAQQGVGTSVNLETFIANY